VGCPAGTVRAPSGLCRPPAGQCPAGTVRIADGACELPPPDPTGPPPTPSRPAHTGELLLTPALVSAGDAVSATGAGCAPAAEVVLRAGGDEVGRTKADSQGRFTAPVRFSTFAAGPLTVTADCGRTLTTTLDMTLASATNGVSLTYVLLLFFLLVASLLIRQQLGTTSRHRR
jgi:hypothetical protein